MSKHSPRRSVRPTIEDLEQRCLPAPVGTVTGTLSQGVWRLTGDDGANQITVVSSGPQGAFYVVGHGTAVTGVTRPKGVHKIVFDMRASPDVVSVNVAKVNSMVFQGGGNGNTFRAYGLDLAGGLQVGNGDGFDILELRTCKIGGSVNVNNGNGGSSTFMSNYETGESFNRIAGHLNISNGVGADYTTITDTDVGGNITCHNGAGDGTWAGRFWFYNDWHPGRRAVVGGNVTVTFQSDNIYTDNGIWDAVVRGNVLFNNGSGAAETSFDGRKTKLPTIIHGKLKIAGTGTSLVSAGLQQRTGLRVGGNFVIDVVNPTDLTLKAFNLIVYGQTKIV